MIIDDLPVLPSKPATGDELAIERGQSTYKVTYNNLVGSEIADVKSNITTLQGNVTTLQNTDSKIESSIAIIVSGDTASMAVPVGGYAYIKDNTHGLAEGLYTNTSSAAFPTVGGTADSTVFTAVSGGGLNAIQSMAYGIVTGTLPNSGSVYFDYPDGFTYENSYCIAFESFRINGWRSGQGFGTSEGYRTFISLESSRIMVYNNDPALNAQSFRIILGKL